MRPLDRLQSIKLKLSILIIAAVAVSAAMSQIGFKFGWPVWLRPIIAGCVSLLMVQFLAHGMTSPLREMARAAERMADGDSDVSVTASSADEVGQLARAFNSMAHNLAQLDAERRAMVSNAAHELRTPIAGLQATLENVADRVIEPTPEVINRLHVQTTRLSHLVADLLDLSRIEAARSLHPVDEVDLHDVVRSALADTAHDRVTTSVPPDTVVLGDATLLERLTSNLVRNGVEHAAGSEVVVTVERTAKHVTLVVSDRGPGLDPHETERLFDRFVRGTDPEGAGRPGTGLGLAICRAVADQHRASITARNRTPTGAEFRVDFPLPPRPT